MEWKGLTAVVTGASSGFGREAAKAFAAKGATVIAVARREGKLKELIDELGGDPHFYVPMDLSELEGVRSLVAKVQERTQRVDILMNNAGVASNGPMMGATSEGIEKLIKINLLSAMWSTKEFLPLLDAAPKTSRTPVVVNVASIAGRIPTPMNSDYTASKFGLVGFTESAWHEMQEMGIRMMMLNPGLAHTEGFPMTALLQKPMVSWTVMDEARVVSALVKGIERGAFEVRVQWWMHPLYLSSVMMGPLRRVVSGAVSQAVGYKGRL